MRWNDFGRSQLVSCYWRAKSVFHLSPFYLSWLFYNVHGTRDDEHKESFEWRQTTWKKRSQFEWMHFISKRIAMSTQKRGRISTALQQQTTRAVFMQFSTVSFYFFPFFSSLLLDPCLTIRRKQHSNTMTNQIVWCAKIPRHRLPNLPHTDCRSSSSSSRRRFICIHLGQFLLHCSIFDVFFLLLRPATPRLSITTENCIILFVTLFVSHFFFVLPRRKSSACSRTPFLCMHTPPHSCDWMQNSYNLKCNKTNGTSKTHGRHTRDTYADAISIICIQLFLAIGFFVAVLWHECEHKLQFASRNMLLWMTQPICSENPPTTLHNQMRAK